MPDDLATKLCDLLNVRSLVGEDAYQRALAELKVAYGAAQVDQVLREQLPSASQGHVSGRTPCA